MFFEIKTGEFDILSQSFPLKSDKFDIPKGFVLRAALKDVAKVATQTCGIKRITRRAVLKVKVLPFLYFFYV